MSVLGTGVAAGVAQTTQQAREVAQRRDRLARQTDQEADRSRQIIDGLVHTVEVDHDHASRLTILDQPPEHRNPPNDEPSDQASQPQDDINPDPSTAQVDRPFRLGSNANEPTDENGGVSTSRADASPSSLYHHLDVQA